MTARFDGLKYFLYLRRRCRCFSTNIYVDDDVVVAVMPWNSDPCMHIFFLFLSFN